MGQSGNLALMGPLLQLGLPEGNLAHGGVGMATSSWEIPADPFRPVSNDTSLETSQTSSEHSFPPYVVICVRIILWGSKHKLRDRVSERPVHGRSEDSSM